METAKEKITTAVTEYKKLFPAEYKAFLKANREKIDAQKDSWGSTGKDGAVERLLYETPEKLHYAIKNMLNENETEWWNNRGDYKKDLSAARWFVETFPEFKVTKAF